MVFFVFFVLSAVLIGVGSMLAPAFPTVQPRVGLASTLALVLVVSGGILWTRFVGWDTLVMDYLLFGLVSLVVLGGTMAQAHQKATGDDATETDIEWMSRSEFLFLALPVLLCLIPLFFPLQLENNVSITTGQTLSEIKATYAQLTQSGATGFYILSAYLSQQLKQDIAIVYPAVMSVMAVLTVLTAYDLGAELRNAMSGRFFATGITILLAIAYAVFPGSLPAMLILLFGLAILIFAIRAIRHRQWQEIVAGILLSVAIVILL